MKIINKGRALVRKATGATARRIFRWGLIQPGVCEVLFEHFRPSVTDILREDKALMREFVTEHCREAMLQILKDAQDDPLLIREFVAALAANGCIPGGGILGAPQIVDGMRRGKIKISPLPELYKVPGHPNGQSPYNPTTVTLQLGTSFGVPRDGVIIDRSRRSGQDYLGDPDCCARTELQVGDKVAILPIGCSERDYYWMERHLWEEYGDLLKLVVRGFLICLTLQTVEFPLPEVEGGEAYAGFLTGRTLHARTGLGWELAPRLNAGDKQPIALEPHNLARAVHVLTAGEDPVVNLTIFPVVNAPTYTNVTVTGQKCWAGRGYSHVQGAHRNGILVLPGAEV